MSISDSSNDGDFGSSSSDDYICDTDGSSSSTDVNRTPVKRRKTDKTVRDTIINPETPSPVHHRVNIYIPENDRSLWKRNGMNSDEKKKSQEKD